MASDQSSQQCTYRCKLESNHSNATMAETGGSPVNSYPDFCRVSNKTQGAPSKDLFTTGCSLKRQPVEIEQTPLGAASFGQEGRTTYQLSNDGSDHFNELVAPLLNGDDDGTNSRVRLQEWFHCCESHVSRIAKGLRLHIMSALFVVLCLWIVVPSPWNKTPPSDENPPENRASGVLDCARTLSGGIGLSEDNRNGTSQWHAVNWFLDGGGIKIEVPDHCVWSSSFGIAYGLIVLRESLGVLDESWHSNVRGEKALEDICHWKRITCNVDKSTVERLTLNHANLSGTIPLELARFSDLNCLQMENNNLIGTLPSEMSRLTKLQDLLLQQTQLSGTIPDSLQQLTVLKRLHLDRTNLSGTMPLQICALRKDNLQFLSANCREKKNEFPFVHCDRPTCCTSCS